MDVLVHIYLWGEEDGPCVGHGEVPALHRERQQVLWNLGNLETARRREGRASLTTWNGGYTAQRRVKTVCSKQDCSCMDA